MRIFFIILLAVWLVPAGADNPAIAGNWVLNTEESDDTEKAMKQIMPKRNHGADRRGKLPRVGKASVANRITLNRLVLSESDLNIGIDGAKISIDYGAPKEGTPLADDPRQPVPSIDGAIPSMNQGEQRRRTLFTDGRGQSVSALDGVETGPGYSFGIWEGDKLFIESRRQQGMIFYETFRLDPDTDTLRHKITVSIPAAGESTDIQRVYERAATGE